MTTLLILERTQSNRIITKILNLDYIFILFFFHETFPSSTQILLPCIAYAKEIFPRIGKLWTYNNKRKFFSMSFVSSSQMRLSKRFYFYYQEYHQVVIRVSFISRDFLQPYQQCICFVVNISRHKT